MNNDLTFKDMDSLDSICEDFLSDTSCNNKKMLTVCQEYLEAIKDENQLTKHPSFKIIYNHIHEQVWFCESVDHVVYFAKEFVTMAEAIERKKVREKLNWPPRKSFK